MSEHGEAPRKGCLRRGCLGCLVIVGAGIGLVVIMAVITLVRGVPDVVREDESRTHSIARSPTESTREGRPLVVDEGRVGRVVLDVSMANFSIIPAPAGSELRLDARYNSGSYKLEESMRGDGETGWTYRLSFGSRSVLNFIHVDAGDNRLELHLPAGTPLTIEGELGVGQTDLQLGGLWVESVKLGAGVGDHRIGFDEPLPVPMSSFELDGSIGETSVSGLGNASPAEVKVRHRIGDIRVDLGGAWRNDAKISVRSSIGGFRIGLPDEDVGFELLRASIGIGEANTRRVGERSEAPAGAPVVQLEASHSIGELLLTR